ncbi:taf7-like rna polymerase ii taf7l, partial [Cystoisospora suis]
LLDDFVVSRLDRKSPYKHVENSKRQRDTQTGTYSSFTPSPIEVEEQGEKTFSELPSRRSTHQAASSREEDKDHKERKKKKEQQTAVRRGLFSATELEDWLGEDCPGLDRQCVIRFPPDVAATLRKRLIHVRQQQHARSSRGLSSTGEAPLNFPPGCTAANPLGLVITPREEWSYRIFDVKCTHTCCSSFCMERPAGDISQMIVVFNPQEPKECLDLHELCERQQWEWKAGLTPPTHRIRSRKFKNLDLFERQEIRDAELQVLELLHSTRRDNYEVEVHTLHEMHQLLDQQTQAAQGKGRKPTVSGIGASEATVEHVVSCDDDVLAWLDSMGMLDAPVGDPEDPSNMSSANSGAISDYSDLLFDLRPSPSSSSSSSSSSSNMGVAHQQQQQRLPGYRGSQRGGLGGGGGGRAGGAASSGWNRRGAPPDSVKGGGQHHLHHLASPGSLPSAFATPGVDMGLGGGAGGEMSVVPGQEGLVYGEGASLLHGASQFEEDATSLILGTGGDTARGAASGGSLLSNSHTGGAGGGVGGDQTHSTPENFTPLLSQQPPGPPSGGVGGLLPPYNVQDAAGGAGGLPSGPAAGTPGVGSSAVPVGVAAPPAPSALAGGVVGGVGPAPPQSLEERMRRKEERRQRKLMKKERRRLRKEKKKAKKDKKKGGEGGGNQDSSHTIRSLAGGANAESSMMTAAGVEGYTQSNSSSSTAAAWTTAGGGGDDAGSSSSSGSDEEDGRDEDGPPGEGGGGPPGGR